MRGAMLLSRRAHMAMPTSFDPTAFSPTFWFKPESALDASDAAITVDGTAVKTLTDLSGNGHHATQSTSGKRALYKTNRLNGRPMIRPDGTDDTFSVTTPPTLTDFTLFVVFLAPSSANDYQGIVCQASGFKGLYYRGLADVLDYYFGDHNGATVMTAGTPHVACVVSNGGGLTLRLDGANDLTGVSGMGTLVPEWLFSATGAANFAAMDTGEILLLPSALSAGDLVAGDEYFRAGWATP